MLKPVTRWAPGSVTTMRNVSFSDGRMPPLSEITVNPTQLQMEITNLSFAVNSNADALESLGKFVVWVAETNPELVKEYVQSTKVAERLER